MSDKKVKLCFENFSVKANGETDVVIEGFANKAVVDRGNDLIEPKAWNLDNYKKSGIILFNHDRDKPIGKAVDVKATDDGLYIKAKISKSKDPQIAMVRDLIREGILNAFSVGFNVDQEEKSNDGVNLIKAAELLETSVVTLPMNQDSLFSLTAKDLGSKAARTKILQYKGAQVASAVHARLDEMVDAGEGQRAEIVEKMTAAAEVEADVMTKALAGDLAPMPADLIAAFASFLGMDEKALLDLNETDCPGEPERKKEEAAAAEEKPEAQESEPKAAAKTKNSPVVAVYQILLPKEEIQSAEEAVAYAEEYGWETAMVHESETHWILPQMAEEAFLSGDWSEVELGDGAMALVGALKPEEPEMEESEEEMSQPAAEDQAPEEKAAAAADAPKAEGEKNPMVEAFLAETQATEESAPGNPAAWVADEALWEKAKRASEEALGRVDYAFVVWWYLNQGGERKGMAQDTEEAKQAEQAPDQLPTAPAMDTAAPVVDDNQYLAQARQTNVLLGTLIALTQEMSGKLDGLVAVPAPMKTELEAAPIDQEPKASEEIDADMAKMVETVAKNLKSVNNILGAFRV